MGNLPADLGGLPLGNTLLTSPSDRTTLTSAGNAFTLVQTWLSGTLVGTAGRRPCARDVHGTYVCVVRYGDSGVGRIYWNPYAIASVRIAPSALFRMTATGSAAPAQGGTEMTVNTLPVLVRSVS